MLIILHGTATTQTKTDPYLRRNVTKGDFTQYSDTQTRIGEGGRNPSNLDLMFCTEDLIHIISYNQKRDNWGSDHHPMAYTIDEEVRSYKRIINRITTKRTDWKLYEEIITRNLGKFSSKEYIMESHIEKYDKVKNTMMKAIEKATRENKCKEKVHEDMTNVKKTLLSGG